MRRRYCDVYIYVNNSYDSEFIKRINKLEIII